MKTLKFLLLLLFFLARPFAGLSQNQVVVNAVVLPPYSTQMSDYVDNPGKLQVNFVNMTSNDLDVYVQGTLTGDNGIEIKTDPNFIMPAPILLPAGVAYQVTPDNVGDIFSPDHLIYTGISKSDILNSQALPEGNYSFCFKVYDYNTHQLLSNEQAGCSNMFSISYKDPPVFTFPQCGTAVNPVSPQNVIISWTTPVGAPPNVRYRFVMVKMQPADRNPYDAIASAAPGTYFIEENDLMIPQIIIDSSYPQLEEGSAYAYYVKAYDPDNQVIFNNNGTSEACSFIYENQQQDDFSVSEALQLEDDNLQNFIDEFVVLPDTHIHGRLFYKPATAAQISFAGGVQSMESTGKDNAYNTRKHANENNEPSDLQGLQGIPYNFDTSDQNNALSTYMSQNSDVNDNSLSMNMADYYSANPILDFNFPPPLGSGTINADLISTNGAKPLANVQVRLIPRISLRTADGLFDTKSVYGRFKWSYFFYEHFDEYKFYDLSGHEVSWQQVWTMLDKALAVSTTDSNGYYNFDFTADFITGPILIKQAGEVSVNNYTGIISLKVEVLNEKFASPDVEIFAYPGDNLQIPDQVALLKTYDLEYQVSVAYDYAGRESNFDVYQAIDTVPKVLQGGSPIPNAKIQVLRDYQELKNEHSAVLLSEGNGKGEIIENQNGKFKLVYEGKTDNNGKLLIENLVKFNPNVSGDKYYVYISTREEEMNKAENTFYNFKSEFRNLFTDLNHFNEYHITDYSTGPVEYNHYYLQNLQHMKSHAELEVAKPEIKGHIMAKTNLENLGLKGVLVTLFNKDDAEDDNELLQYQQAYLGKDWVPDLYQVSFYRAERVTSTTEAGFFRFKNLRVSHEKLIPTGPYRRIEVGSDQYGTGRFYKKVIIPPLEHRPYNFKYGDLKYLKIQLEPRHLLKGEVVDENGKPVAAYLRVLPDTPYVKTETSFSANLLGNNIESHENFSLPVAENGINMIEVLPLSHQYYPDTLRLENLPSNNFLRVEVRKKKHRLILIVKDANTGKIIRDASVVIGDSLAYGKTGNGGKVLLKFESPGEQFVCKISADNYSPVQKIYSIPVSASDYLIKTVQMQPARSIAGKITEKKSGKAIEGALIYTELQNTGGISLYLKARSDAQGNYLLKGIPDNYKNIFVHVVKEGGNPSYIGLEKNLIFNDLAFTMENGQLKPVKYDFQLEAIQEEIADIWHFPVALESVKRNNGKIEEISGYLYNLPGNLYINTLNSEQKVYFSDLPVKTENGKLVPQNDYFYTQNHNIPVKLDGGFAGDLSMDLPLRLTKVNDSAYISGRLKLQLSSFSFAYDFHGNMYLGESTDNPYVKAFTAQISPLTPGQAAHLMNMHKTYRIFDLKQQGNSFVPVPLQNYKVFGFTASSLTDQSTYTGDKISIATILHTDIPLPNGQSDLDLKIKAGYVEVSKDNLEMKTSDTEFEFDLEKWKIRSAGHWYFDKNRDAIVMAKASLNTGTGVQVNINNLLIRPHALREGDLDVGKGFTLGGVVALHTNKDLQPVFNYDAGVGHYRISLVGNSDKPAAWTDKLPAMDRKLEFKAMDLLSDNSSEMSLGQKIRFHRLIDVYVDQMMSGDGFFSLAGMPEMHIPGWVSGQANMTYYKEGGKLKFKIEPLNAKVDCNANVVYRLDVNKDKQSLTDRLYTAYGEFEINPPPGESGEKLLVKAYLVKKPDKTYIDVLDQIIKIGKEKMHITGGKISVENDVWNELHYQARTMSKGLDPNNIVNFTVHGGIEVDSDKIQVNHMDTPFGKLYMAYLFPETALLGSLIITKPINVGFAGINNGIMEMRFDPDGFYSGIAANVTINGMFYEGGLVLGTYSHDLRELSTLIFAKMYKKPKDLSGGIEGFYFMGQKTLINETFTLVSPLSISVDSGVGAYLGLDFSDTASFTGGGYAYLDAEGGVDVGLCYLGFSTKNFLDIQLLYEKKKLSLCACGKTKFTVNACSLKGTIDVLFRAKSSTSNPLEDISLSLSSTTCPVDLCH